jgi:hypothetical protein
MKVSNKRQELAINLKINVYYCEPSKQNVCIPKIINYLVSGYITEIILMTIILGAENNGNVSEDDDDIEDDFEEDIEDDLEDIEDDAQEDVKSE